jgi:phosphoadenosine phosphosulfate reductase
MTLQHFANENPLQETVARLSTTLEGAEPEIVIAAVREAVLPGAFAVVSSFGTESAVLLDAMARVDSNLPVLLLDTGWLFPETLDYRDELVARFDLNDVRALQPDAAEQAERDPDDFLWSSDPDACCALRKVRPLERALTGFSAWANGRKRYQGGLRSRIPVVEVDGPRLKVNPLAGLNAKDVERRFDRLGLPPHPLQDQGYQSVGCVPCTSRRRPGEDVRAGRWRGHAKTECGIHMLGSPGC